MAKILEILAKILFMSIFLKHMFLYFEEAKEPYSVFNRYVARVWHGDEVVSTEEIATWAMSVLPLRGVL